MSSQYCFRPKVKPSKGLTAAVAYHPDNNDTVLKSDSKSLQCSSSTKQLLRMVGITIIPILILVAMNAVFVHDAITASRAMIHVRNRIKSGLEEFSLLIHRLEIERGTTALYISSGSLDIHEALQGHYVSTDFAISNITNWQPSASKNDQLIYVPYLKTKETFHTYIESFRNEVNPNKTTLHQDIVFYTDVIDVIKRRFLSDFQIAASQGIWPKLVSYELLVQAKGYAGIKRALGSTFYARGGFYNHSTYEWFLENSFYGQVLLETSMYYTPMVKTIFDEYMEQDTGLNSSLQEMEGEIRLNQVDSIESSWQKGDEWFGQMTHLIDNLLLTQNRIAGDIMTDLNIALEELQKDYIISVLILTAVLLMSPVIIQGIYKQTQKIQMIGNTLQMRTLQLEEERVRAESLLNQMLPPMIAEQLKVDGTVHAEFFKDVTVFFSDLVNFTLICTISTPMQVMFTTFSK